MWVNFFEDNVYGLKIISPKTGLQEKNVEKKMCRNIFMVAKSFPRNRFEAKKVFDKDYRQKILYVFIIVSRKTVSKENFFQ